jgi:MFS transporter, DHA1 family, multidrug resistance protein
MSLRPASPAFTLFLAALVGMPALSIDMSLPGLSIITAALSAPVSSASLMLTTLLAGFGGAQLAFGPLSDRFGRRPVLLVGLAMFALASAMCALATSLTWLLVARALQGIGAAAGTVLAFAMVQDCFEGEVARQRIATINTVMALAPVVAPIIGALVLRIAGWRGIFAVLGFFGAGLLAVSLLGTAETIGARNPSALRFGGLFRSYGRALTNRVAFGNTLVGAFAFGDLFSFISGSPLVYVDQLGVSGVGFAAIFASASAGLMMGSLAVGRLRRGGLLMPAGMAITILSGAGLLGLHLAGQFAVAPSVALLVANAFGCGFIFPNATHGALAPFRDMAGVASAVNGAVRMAGGALASAAATPLYDGTPLAMSLGVLGSSLAAAGVWLLLVRPGGVKTAPG